MRSQPFLTATLTGTLALISAGCGGKSGGAKVVPADLKPFEALAETPLEAGVGWGPIRLGETTLADLVNDYPPTPVRYRRGVGTLMLGDDSAAEITYGRGQVSFMVLIPRSLLDQFMRGKREFTTDPKKFVESYPECGELPLSSLSIGAGETREGTFYKGETGKGVRLWGPPSSAKAHGPRPASGHGPAFLAGLDAPREKGNEVLPYGSGVVFYKNDWLSALITEASDAGEIDPENLGKEDLERAAGAIFGHVLRITVYRP